MKLVTFPLQFISSATTFPSQLETGFPQEKSTQPCQLQQLLELRKASQNLIYTCDIDEEGNLNCRWVQACSL